jgi:Lrp/AsnC family transcriptional regulator, leucine-responsive regulatory protein
MDSELLTRLQANARETWAALAQALGVTGPAIAERVRKLEERGVIRGYSAIVDAEAVGYPLLAFIAVTLEQQEQRTEFITRVLGLPEVQECHHIAGDYDYLVKVRARGTADLDRLITEELKSLPGVRTRTTIVLKTAKETLVVPIRP